jgi:hypothetical protein
MAGVGMVVFANCGCKPEEGLINEHAGDRGEIAHGEEID